VELAVLDQDVPSLHHDLRESFHRPPLIIQSSPWWSGVRTGGSASFAHSTVRETGGSSMNVTPKESTNVLGLSAVVVDRIDG
jgi:hypothetical protein